MSYIMLKIASMIALTEGLVDPDKDRPMMLSHQLLAAFLPALVAAHNGLLRVTSLPSIAQNARALAQKATDLEARYDELYRAMYSVLTGWAVAANASRRTMLERVRQTLFPHGMGGINHSHLRKAGNAEVAMSRMSPEIEAALREFSVDGRTLFELFNDWVNIGAELGKVVQERARLGDVTDAEQISPGEIQRAKVRWVQAVRALIMLLELETDIPDDVRNHILQPLRAAYVKRSRKKKSKAEGEDKKPDTPSDDEHNNADDADNPTPPPNSDKADPEAAA